MRFSSIENIQLDELSETATNVLSVIPVSISHMSDQLIVEVSFIDEGKVQTGYLSYNINTSVYTNIAKLIDEGGEEVINITGIDITWSEAGDSVMAVAYIDKSESVHLSTTTGNRIAIIVDEQLQNKDIIEWSSGQIANSGINKLVIDGSGTQLAFSTEASNLINYPDANGISDVFLVDVNARSLIRVTQITKDDEGSDPSYVVDLYIDSTNATQILFETVAQDFSLDDSNEKNDLYIVNPGIEENSINLLTLNIENEASSFVKNQALFKNETLIYVSDSDNIVVNDSNQSQDIFVKDVIKNSIERVTRVLDGQITGYDMVKYELLGVDNNLNYLMFSSNYSTLTSDSSLYQIYVMNLDTYTVEMLTKDSNGVAGNDSSVMGVISNTGDDFAYQTYATNLSENSNYPQALISIANNRSPYANNDHISSIAEDSLEGIINVLINDYDHDKDVLEVNNAVAENGVVTINEDGTLNYTPDENFYGTDVITYTITDNAVDEEGNSVAKESTAKVYIVIENINDVAIITGDTSVSLTETDDVLTASGTLTSADVDNANNQFTATTDALVGGYGSLTIDADGNWNYTANSTHDNLAKDEVVTDIFEVSSIDGTGATVTIAINGTENLNTLAMVHLSDGELLDDTVIHFNAENNGSVLSLSLINGVVDISQHTSFAFETIDPTANTLRYSDKLDILDLYGVLDLIGQEVGTLPTHSADMDNNDEINIMDLYQALDGIGQAPQSFDLVDQQTQLRVTSLDVDIGSTVHWNVIANGDVDFSGELIIASDFV